jgi:hypothetical protein
MGRSTRISEKLQRENGGTACYILSTEEGRFSNIPPAKLLSCRTRINRSHGHTPIGLLSGAVDKDPRSQEIANIRWRRLYTCTHT